MLGLSAASAFLASQSTDVTGVAEWIRVGVSLRVEMVKYVYFVKELTLGVGRCLWETVPNIDFAVIRHATSLWAAARPAPS